MGKYEAASENFDAFIVLRSSRPGKIPRKTPVQDDPVWWGQISPLFVRPRTSPCAPFPPTTIAASQFLLVLSYRAGHQAGAMHAALLGSFTSGSNSRRVGCVGFCAAT